ncbi:hypothetical protein C8Q73DRAFT_677611 [Cubamyces lactineus]|nr:hypothetical protein C8Q73DRAFT_677611 [Cubamyces lactineus]
MVRTKDTRSSVYERPRFYPLSLYAARCKSPGRTLQALMGMENNTPSFKAFVETARKWADRLLVPTEPKEGQAQSQWQKFEDKLARRVPYILKYEDHWPAEYYVKIWIRLVYHKNKMRKARQKGKARARTPSSSPTADINRTPSNSPSRSPSRSPVAPSPEPTRHVRATQAKAPEINLKQAFSARRQSLNPCIRAPGRVVPTTTAPTQQPEAGPIQGAPFAQSFYQAAATTAGSASAASPRKSGVSELRPVIVFLSSRRLTHLLPVLASIGVRNRRTLLGLACMPNRRIWMERVLGQRAIGNVDWKYLQDGLDELELTDGYSSGD